MIRLNLLGEKEDKSAIYALQLTVFSAACLVSLVACFLMFTSVSEAVSNLEQEQQALDHRLTALRNQTKQVEDLEQKRKLLREKLNTISTLKLSKQEPVRLLDGIATAVPEHAWLTKIDEKDGYLTIDGAALDNQTVSHFMYNLQQMPLVADVKLIISEMFIKDNVQLKQFSLSVQTARKAKELQRAAETAAAESAKDVKKAKNNAKKK